MFMLTKQLGYCGNKSLIFVLLMWILGPCTMPGQHRLWKGSLEKRGAGRHPSTQNTMKGEMRMLLRAPREMPATPHLRPFPGERCSGYSALPQASGFLAGHLLSSVLTCIGLGSYSPVSREMGEEILLWFEWSRLATGAKFSPASAQKEFSEDTCAARTGVWCPMQNWLPLYFLGSGLVDFLLDAHPFVEWCLGWWGHTGSQQGRTAPRLVSLLSQLLLEKWSAAFCALWLYTRALNQALVLGLLLLKLTLGIFLSDLVLAYLLAWLLQRLIVPGHV